MKLLLFFILLVIFTLLLPGEKIAVFSEPINPSQLQTDGRQIYVVDFPYVYIYSAKDYSLKKKLGEEGEGPLQFMYARGSLVNRRDAFQIDVRSEQVIVTGQGKVAFFTKDGTYQKEAKTEHRHDYRFAPLGEKFIALTQRRGNDGDFYVKLNIHNTKLKQEKEIFKFKRFSQPPAGDLNVVYDKGVIYDMYDNKIVVTAIGKEDSVIEVFDLNGKNIYSITHKYDRQEVTEAHKKRYLDYYKAGPLRAIWGSFKDRIKFPGHFPGLRDFRINGGKIYVLTIKKEKGNSEFIIFNIKGKVIKKVSVPLKEKEIYCYPYMIWQGKVYQLIENEEMEQWELHSAPIE
jgi:hypothetical protein